MPHESSPGRRRCVVLPISRRLALVAAVVPVAVSTGTVAAQTPDDGVSDELAVELADGRTLDGFGNNVDDPTLGQAGTIYTRVAEANYADDVGALVDGPDQRSVSNRIFNDVNQNVFSENGVTHWSFVWGQFIDHTIGLRESSDEDLVVAFDADDPLEEFTNDLGAISTTRSAAAAGTGDDSVREQINTISSYIDAWAVYGGSDERLDWLRAGTVDGDPTNNDASLLLVDGYLPTSEARPDTETPEVELAGRLFADPTSAVIAGDVRVNENLGLTAVQTLFALEHNRIVDALPDDLDEQTKFEIAQRSVAALQQYITYNEFLPAMGVELDDYTGYDPTVDPTITNEFATVGYRAHSTIHGEFEGEIDRSAITDDEIAALEAQGVEVTVASDVVEYAIPLNVAFGNPGLLEQVGLGSMLAGLASEAAYANDEQIDNQLRSVLFQVPGPDVEDPASCLDGTEIAGCFTIVNDLGALDMIRAADHGMPSYNDLREAYGLERVESFTEITGEDTDQWPDDPEIDLENPIDDPDILDFVYLADADGNVLEAGTDEADGDTVTAVRRTTTAARLQAIYGDVDSIDAFTGMVSEAHVDGTEFGELQLAMWTSQFAALRDGDRFFYGNDGALDLIADEYGIDYRRTLADVIVANSDVEPAEIADNVFLLPQATEEPSDASDDQAADAADGGTSDETPDDESDEDQVDGERRRSNRPRDRDGDADRDGRRHRRQQG
ncbi:heme peroxidase [Ilumatobacter fluminis]|uniref:Heme peroxidase n=1 Tax=Ilumatobacter fluminis TaxID=467091 RepID=A0A4R7I3L1_9ACTN|nr:peroxidase family protein [Ilumatobacter fluminis]TDT18171.1 heme peroxidase [Ilumatobacter fluminis]